MGLEDCSERCLCYIEMEKFVRLGVEKQRYNIVKKRLGAGETLKDAGWG